MNKIGFIFQSPPHSTTKGREGLDAILATASYSDNIGLFFVGDGVFQLLEHQEPEAILSRDYIASFSMLGFYDIKEIFVSDMALLNRGIDKERLCINTHSVSSNVMRQQLSLCTQIMVF